MTNAQPTTSIGQLRPHVSHTRCISTRYASRDAPPTNLRQSLNSTTSISYSTYKRGAAALDLAEQLEYLLSETKILDSNTRDQKLKNIKRLQTALKNSMVCVVAFIPDEEKTKAWTIFPKQKLVGFARAVGDATLVATIHDVAVLPELQRLGIGRRLLNGLTYYLQDRGVVDIGVAVTDREFELFLEACDFGDDTEGSTAMRLVRMNMNM